MQSYRVGIDLGGTKLLGIVTDEKHTIHRNQKQFLSESPALEDIIKSIAALYREITAELKPESIDVVGLAIPGPVDPVRGIVKYLTAFGWKNIPVTKLLKEEFGLHFQIGNDVNLATLAEFHLGAGRGAGSLYTFYPGTGLGGGYISGGKLVYGFNHTAAEVGHMVVQIDGPECNCGQRGCLEAIVSNSGFKQLLRKVLQEEKSSILQNTAAFRSEQIVSAWQAGDRAVREVLSFQAKALGIGVANVINLTGVERIIIGGNVYQKLKDDLIPIVKKYAIQHAIGGGMEGVEIRLNELGNEAPALGATLI